MSQARVDLCVVLVGGRSLFFSEKKKEEQKGSGVTLYTSHNRSILFRKYILFMVRLMAGLLSLFSRGLVCLVLALAARH